MRHAKKILVYAIDYENDGTPILALAKEIDDISADCADEIVGIYNLQETLSFRVRKVLETRILARGRKTNAKGG